MSGPIARAILQQTAADHGLPVAVMLQRSRSPDRVAARFDAMRRLRAVTRLDGRPRFSLPQIGEMLGLHHTSVLNGLRRMEALSLPGEGAHLLSSRPSEAQSRDPAAAAERLGPRPTPG
jgi:PAS domain-containing protein